MQKRDLSTNKLPKIPASDSTLSSKLYNLTGLRIFQAKFMEDLRYPRHQQKILQGRQTNNQNFSQTVSNKPTMTLDNFTGKDMANENKQEKHKQLSSIIKQEKLVKRVEKIKILNGRPKGLKNLGNTCYLNAVLQSLLALEQFNFALEKQIKLKKQQKSLAVSYSKIVNCYRTCGEKQIVNPSEFKYYMGKRKDRFAGNSQQDAQQLLTAFLQGINEEISRVKTKQKYREMHGDPTKDTIKNIADQWWNYFKEKDDSVVCDYFQGQIESTIVCSECNFKSLSFDNFWGFPVTLRQKGNSDNLSQLITDNFRTESRLQDYCCQKCKRENTCSKTVKIFRLPVILVIHIKRFVYGVRKQKIKDRIAIPIDFSLKEVISKDSREANTNYYLKSTIEHSGQLNFGHYTGHVYSEKEQKWFCVDDSSIEQQNVNKDSPQLYVLFYCQR